MSQLHWPLGATRSRVTSKYALICPDTHVAQGLAGWRNATGIVHISPELGARFFQYTAMLDSHAESALPGEGIQRFVYVLEGTLELRLDKGKSSLKTGSFAYLPANCPHQIATGKLASPTRIQVFEKRYCAADSVVPSELLFGHAEDVPSNAFMGDDALRLQVLLPATEAFDMAVNIFTYQPGGVLPQVEIHVMEHGLLMLDGAGVYRLGDDYFPVQQGDVIWMASYCQQWFVAMGKTPARYLYYKDVHRDRLVDRGDGTRRFA